MSSKELDTSGYEEFAGQGLDDLTNEDKGIPFFEILQKQSPEVEEIDDAKPGMIIDKASKELFDDICFVPVCRQHGYTEWVPRDSGGGMVGFHPLDSDIVRQARSNKRFGKHELENGNELLETFYLYGMVLDKDENPKAAVISFTSTKIQAYKTLATRADSLMFKAKDGRKLKFPWFAHKWRLGTEKKQKDKFTWFNWTVKFDGENDKAEEARLPADHPAVIAGSNIFASHRSGQLKVNTEGMKNEQLSSSPRDRNADVNDSGDGSEPPF